MRFIGGCVRDAVLGITANDMDLATTLLPNIIMEHLTTAGIKVIPTGLSHGTITAVVNHIPYQITTLRRDIDTDGRHAIVAYTDDWQIDALRRDFTINALSLDAEGHIYDYTNGLTDLNEGRLRFIGQPQLRIQEDYLRILRYFRFLSRFDHQDDDHETLNIITINTPKLLTLSWERIAMEWQSILNQANPDRSLRLMLTCGVLKTLFNVDHISEHYVRLRQCEHLWQSKAQPWRRRLVALMGGHCDQIIKVCHLLKLSNKDTDYIKSLAHMLSQPQLIPFTGIYHYGLELYQDYLLLSHQPDRDTLWQQAVIIAQQKIQFPLSGQDLIGAGLQPGPHLGQILTQIETWWSEHKGEPDHSACLAYYRLHLSPHN